MAVITNSARDPKQPVVFDLTDNDQVALIPWEYVVDKFETILDGVINSIELMNRDLQRINNRVDEWLDEQNE